MFTIILLFLLIALVTTVFLAKELVKKFKFLKNYTDDNKNKIQWHYLGSATEELVPGMQTIVLSVPGGKKFSALIAFELELPFGNKGVDQFGYLYSKGGVIAFSTYLGKGECNFIFLINGVNAVEVKNSIDLTGEHKPTQTYPPHWWQRLGFWG